MTRAAFSLLLLLLPSGLYSHEIRPAYLEIKEATPGVFDVLWKLPVAGERYLPLDPIFPPHCEREDERPIFNPGALVQRIQLNCGAAGLDNATVTIDALPRTLTDVFVRIAWQDGKEINSLLKPDSPSLVVRRDASSIINYLFLGIEHLLSGIDHILFVVGLLLLIGNTWTLIKTITAFTLAHSITLGLSALNVVQLSQSPVEVAIALSILYLAVELSHSQPQDERGRVRPKTTSLIRDYPWLIAFVFGLLHGFGFAGALRDVGLPDDTAIWALLLFNLGVEIGQLMIVFTVLGGLWISRHFSLHIPLLLARAPVWLMGTLSAYWVIDRSLQLI